VTPGADRESFDESAPPGTGLSARTFPTNRQPRFSHQAAMESSPGLATPGGVDLQNPRRPTPPGNRLDKPRKVSLDSRLKISHRWDQTGFNFHGR